MEDLKTAFENGLKTQKAKLKKSMNVNFTLLSLNVVCCIYSFIIPEWLYLASIVAIIGVSTSLSTLLMVRKRMRQF